MDKVGPPQRERPLQSASHPTLLPMVWLGRSRLSDYIGLWKLLSGFTSGSEMPINASQKRGNEGVPVSQTLGLGQWDTHKAGEKRSDGLFARKGKLNVPNG